MVMVTVMIVVDAPNIFTVLHDDATSLSGVACLWHKTKISVSDPIMMYRASVLYYFSSLLVIGLFCAALVLCWHWHSAL